jgi:hypothetical protein
MLARASEAGRGRPERIARSARSTQPPAIATVVSGAQNFILGILGLPYCNPQIK